jgi:pyridoxal phosphate enzyme (YggS family)
VTRAEELAANLAAFEERLAATCAAAGRPREDITVVAVTKTFPATDVLLMRDLGVRDFGENRDAEAAAKAAAVTEVRWHFVGAVQTNKARSVASYADVVHSLDRPALVTALSLGALLQVSLDGAPGRGGAAPADVPSLADGAAAAAGLRLAGVMAVAPLGADARVAFERLAAVADEVRRQHPAAQMMSAGMSGDLEAAVAAGANVLRVGTALFGTRPPLLR